MSIVHFSAKFKSHLDLFNTSPYLFIGSGLSRRYLNLPTWYDLLSAFSRRLELPYEFGFYASQVEGDLPKLASILAEHFHKIWWTSETFAANREKFSRQAQLSVQQPFKIELAQFVSEMAVLNNDYNEEIDLLRSAVIDGVITTNWDEFTNSLLEDFEVFIGQNQLLFSDNTAIGEIYKIHGTVGQPESIVVTTEDYVSFHKKNQFLAAKLFTIFAEHPIIFLGYSLSDSNIISILNSIVECVDNSNIEKLRDRLIFVEWSPDVEDMQMLDGNIVIERMPLPIKHIKLNSFLPLYKVLASLKQRLPIKVLRKCRNAVYELIKTNNPVKTMLVGDLDNIKDDDDVQFVIGVGVANLYSEQGYIGISNDNIFEDIIHDNKGWDAEIVIKDVLPKLFKGNTYLPLYKYLRQSGELDDNGQLFETGNYGVKVVKAVKENTVKIYYPKSITYLRKHTEIKDNCTGIADLVTKYGNKHALYYIPFLKKENIDLDELLEFLKDNYNEDNKKNTDIRKMVCFYDYLKYGIQIDIIDHAVAVEQTTKIASEK
ncbi:SIR2 family protein [Mucilaginibacter sp. JRF]|uniref:SIR2 family protein n=1 Tax=Mucilaginibacter sp. JRF TaxID=2780088 RepID=UPI00187E034C|nr:SIR2 family protein [Mucilaginibacter sp. JRF]MBE9584000.1 SIR2 family protein [Mucilaginibacter sp. JRF]